MSVEKNGGDATNVGIQTADSDASNINVASAGLGAVEGFGGNALAQGAAESTVKQALFQFGEGGDAGDDNTHANTAITV